jgi:hypothetical protein
MPAQLSRGPPRDGYASVSEPSACILLVAPSTLANSAIFAPNPSIPALKLKEAVMIRPGIRRGMLLGLALTALSVAPAPPEEAPPRSALAEARLRAARRQFEEVWTYYRQSRTDSFQTYYWSRLVLDSERDLSPNPADRIAAHEAHLDRMKKLEALVKKVRRLGFGFSTDVGATEYYRLEAEYWLSGARAG